MKDRLISYSKKISEIQKGKNITVEIENCANYDIEKVADKIPKCVDELNLKHKNVTIREDEKIIKYDEKKVPSVILFYLADKVGSEVYYKEKGKITKCVFEAVFYDIHEGITLCLENYEEKISLVSGVEEIGKTVFFDETEAKNN